jgi:predicted nucleotide-binding protein (sugar kinase/HSP70/actin superfamily)
MDQSAGKIISFHSFKENVGVFNLRKTTCLIPEMNRIGSHLMAAVFRSFGISAQVMETFKALDLGMAHTSGKECYPCQITMGDILYCLKHEQERLGDRFRPDSYVYFMPESAGPCRFGMYNKYQRIVLDSFPGLDKLKIISLTTHDGYSIAGMLDGNKVRDFRKAAYLSVVVGDVMDRLLCRIRPYEKAPGLADAFMEKSLHLMGAHFEQYGARRDFGTILSRLDEVVEEGKALIDPHIPPKPRIGIVGEIYLRTHTRANQDLIRKLESFGAEVVNASIAEWVNYTSYDRLRDAKIELKRHLKQRRFSRLGGDLRTILGYAGDLGYQQWRQNRVYERVGRRLPLPEDHKIGHLEHILKEEDIFSFDAGTEACLSIAGIVAYAREGYNGIVNVYPFACMPSTATSAIARPLMNGMGVPYLDTPYDSSSQPGREAAIRTFMYQASQHFKRQEMKAHPKRRRPS